MRRLFQRVRQPDCSGLGASRVALEAAGGVMVPKGCVGLVFDARGNTRRVGAGQRAAAAAGQSVRLFHPGPYVFEVAPYPMAPEAGLRFELSVDGPDPRLAQQRFDLFLAAEAPAVLGVEMLAGALETALQRELEQGKLFLPPCTTLDEWNAFRQGVNELVYTRFGMIVDDCVPVDLGGQVDFAAQLARRGEAGAATPGALQWAVRAAQALRSDSDEAAADARALRRLFLELPSVMAGLRLALPGAQVPFAAAAALLGRLDAAVLSVDTMPAYALAAPSEALDAAGRARRAAASLAALEALDECWSLLARMRAACIAGDACTDEADRIVANLESALAERRCAIPHQEAA